MLRIGVLGAGHLGKIHLKCIKMIEQYDLVGFYDPDPLTAKTVSEELGLRCFASVEELINAVEVVDIVTPTVQHFRCASMALQARRHVFIEKPVVATPEEATQLVRLAGEAGVKVQVGHVERFNPAFITAEPYLHEPKFIEAHRLAFFNPRGTDVPVVLDLMVHDLDILLSVVHAPVARVSACGVAVVSPTPDITNARIEFENGIVANLTASRLSLKNMRKMRFFQEDAYISVDFLDHKTEIVRIQEDSQGTPAYSMSVDLADGQHRQITMERPEVQPLNAIQTELKCFYDSIIHNTSPVVTVHDGVKVLNLAYEILKSAEAHRQFFQK